MLPPFAHLTSLQDFLVHRHDKRGTGENMETENTAAETQEKRCSHMSQQNAACNSTDSCQGKSALIRQRQFMAPDMQSGSRLHSLIIYLPLFAGLV